MYKCINKVYKFEVKKIISGIICQFLKNYLNYSNTSFVVLKNEVISVTIQPQNL